MRDQEKIYKTIIKIILICATVATLLMLCRITVKAEEVARGTCGDNLTWVLDDKGTLAISGKGEMENYNGYNASPWSQKIKEIVNIVIDSRITSIGDFAFAGCVNLENVTDMKGIISIGKSSFADCSSLESITIPEGAVIVKDNAFSFCRSLNYVDLPKTMTEIGKRAFCWCDSLTNITIPLNVSSIGEEAFANCRSLKNINVDPENLFLNSLNDVLYNKDLTELICYPACKNDSSFVVPQSVTSIHPYAFTMNAFIKTIIIPDTVSFIGEGAFNLCYSLSEVSFSDKITEISDKLFRSCSSLSSIHIPDSVTTIGTEAFAFCDSLVDVVIPEGVKTIKDYAFSGCSEIKCITIPQSVNHIGTYVFENCGKLEGVNVADNNEKYISYEGIIYNKQLNTLILYPPGKEDNSFTVPEGITCLDNSAFASCKNLCNIILPDTVNSIGFGCFSYCNSLTELVIPNSVNRIESNTFYGCSSLTTVFVPESVTYIGYNAFGKCESLSIVALPDNGIELHHLVFQECHSLKAIQIPENVSSLGKLLFSECNLSEIFYEGSIEEWKKINSQWNTVDGELIDFIDSEHLYTSERIDESSIPEVSITDIPGGVLVSMNSVDSSIYYTLDGSIPCTASSPFEGDFILNEPGEYFINARAFNFDEGKCSPVCTEYISIEQSEKPVISERNGQVSISGDDDIYYTIDLAEDPSTTSYKYSSPLRFDKTTVIKARCIEPGKAASEVAGYTYYAGSASGITFPEESYGFENTKQSFGYKGFVYRIPEERYLEIFGSSVGEFLYDEYGADAWGGSCFGMSATSLLFHKGMLDLTDYSDEAENVNALHAPASADSLLTRLVERYQISQFLPEVMEERGDISEGGNMVISGISGNAEEAEALLTAVRNGLAGGDPVILIVWRQDLSGSHAVVPYKVEDGRIYVYDCNNPNRETYISYRAGNNGSYTFRFGEYSYAVSYNLFSTLMNGIESCVDIGNAILSSEDEQQMLISADSQDITILDSNGQDATGLISYRATEDIDTEDTVMCLPSGSYRITNNDVAKNSITISVATDDDYHKLTVHDPNAVIEVNIRNGKVYLKVTLEGKAIIESSVISGAGYKNIINLTSTYAEIYSTTDKTVVFRTKSASVVTNGKKQELMRDVTDTQYYLGAAVSKDAEKGAKLFSADGKYTLSTDITELPGEDFNLTVLATGGDENTMLYVASYSSTGRQIGITGVKMTAGKTRYPFSISKKAVEVKVFLVSADKYKPLVKNAIIK